MTKSINQKIIKPCMFQFQTLVSLLIQIYSILNIALNKVGNQLFKLFFGLFIVMN